VDDGSRERARRFAALLADTDGAGAAADAIESLT
jgi:hypothetical protein